MVWMACSASMLGGCVFVYRSSDSLVDAGSLKWKL